MSVGLVVVSHSPKIAEGVVDLAAQMAGDVAVRAAGGSGGEIGTDATLIAEAITGADSGDGVLVLVDLGSAVLSAQLAVDELLEGQLGDRVRLSDAPLVEGTVIGAVQASTGASLDEVEEAARGTATMRKTQTG